MNKIGKFFVNILIVVYAVVAVAVTVLLLSYNDYRCSVLGNYTFIILTDDELEDDGYPEGSLVMVKETKAKNINVGDDIFLYRRISTSEFEIKYAEVLMKDTSGGEYDVKYVLEGSAVVSHSDVIGSTKDIIVVPHLGTILSILESRYGYLFLIVVVSFIVFLYEIYELIMEIKYGEREEEDDDEDYDDEEYDDDEYDDDEEEDEEEEEEVKPKKKSTTTKKATVKKTTTPKKASTTAKTTKTSTTAKKATTAKKTSTTTKKATTARKTTTSKE